MTGHVDPGGGAPGDEERIARHLRETVLKQVRGDIDERVQRDFPSERFFAGALAPESEGQLADPDDDLQSKMNPSGLGATVRLRGDSGEDELHIEVTGSVWVRVNPTYEEMVNRDSFVALGDRDDDDDGDELLPVFERLELEIDPIRVPFSAVDTASRETPEIVEERASSAFAEAFQDAQELALREFDVYVTTEDDDTVPTRALEDEQSFNGYLAERAAEGDGHAIPDWSASLNLETMADHENGGDTVIVDLEVANEAVQSRDDAVFTIRDPTLFEVGLDLQTTGNLEFVPFTFDPLPEDFRYNRDLWGHGRNCTVTAPDREDHQVDDDGRPPGVRAPGANPTTTHLETQFIPEYRQYVYESADRGVDAHFNVLTDLQNGGLDLLEDIAAEMRDYLSTDYDAALAQYSERDDWDDSDLADFNDDRDAFEREIERFERGVQCLRQHPETVGRAFELMNESMDRMHEFPGWRLFQLVFIVMQVPDVASREYDEWSEVTWRTGETDDRAEETDAALDIVDVLWFPTGGGKTEAFLGVAVWSMFFDRLRGKDFGVTAWTRFPLRLLSLQQFQRMTETVMYADLVRREQEDIDTQPSRPFSVGYLVGKANTPNSLTGYDNNNLQRYQGPDGEQLREEAKVVPSCPACDARVKVRVTDNHRLAHYCTGNSFDCAWQERSVSDSSAGTIDPYAEDELPVHVVDNELYRYAPTILAGTIDKITAIGYQRKVAHLLTGEMDCECPIHGFASLSECTEKYGCSIDRDDFAAMASPVESYDAAPSLMVPDELHLLEESMGSFDGHYETGVAALQEFVEAGTTKVIAPTATITGFEDQVDNLFMRAAERFPSPGPFLRENFYAQERPETQRYYIGLVPHGKTHINAIIDLLFYYHREIQNLFREALEEPTQFLTGAALQGTDTTEPLDADSINEVLSTLTYYSTSITYLLSKKDGDRLDQSIVSQLDTYLRKDDRPPLASERMTGGTGFETIMGVLDTVEDPWDEEMDEQILNRLADQEVIDDAILDDVLALRRTLEASLDDDNERVDGEQFQGESARAGPETREALAWLLASRLNTITATSMIAHGVDVDRFNMMTFFGMPRGTAEYIQASSRAGRSEVGLVFNMAHPIRERDLSHYHFFEKYHAFLDRLVEPVPINRWAKNSVKQTHPGLFMGLLLNHYMYHEDAGNLYFGDNAEEFVDSVDERTLLDQMAAMYGEATDKEEFMDDVEDLTREALSQLRLDDSKWTSGRVKRSPMRSLRDVDEPLPIRSEYRFREIFETLDNR